MSTFRHKHYEMFALAVKRARARAAREATELGYPDCKAQQLGVNALQYELMEVFKADNPAFQVMRFIKSSYREGLDDNPYVGGDDGTAT